MAKGVNRTRLRASPKPKPMNSQDVFINCPFDPAYLPFFYAIIWTVIRSGYRARCAQEIDDGGQNRIGKIMDIIAECRFGVHDISNTDTDGDPPLPRFNMPLELGLWFGAHRFGGDSQREKRCIILDRDRYRFQRYISDIAGQDIHSHEGKIDSLIRELSAWLRNLPGGEHPGGGKQLIEEYRKFEAFLPATCAGHKLAVDELTFVDFHTIAGAHIASLREAPVEPAAVAIGTEFLTALT